MIAVDGMEVSPKSERGNTKVVVVGDTYSVCMGIPSAR
jgi:hypothetical protein